MHLPPLNHRFYVQGLIAVIFILALRSASYAEYVRLEDALELFYKNNYDLLINRYETDKAAADLLGASLRLNPNLSVNYTGLNFGTGNYSDIGQPRLNLGNTTIYDTGNTQLAVRIDQPIELGGKRELRTASARETLEATKLSHKDVIRNLLLGFYNSYYNIYLDRLNIDFAKGELKRFEKTLAIAEKRYNAGFLTQNDFTKVKLAMIELENNITNLETKYKNDLEDFNLLLGSNRRIEPAVTQADESFQEYTEEGLIEKAQNNRPDLLSAQKQLKAAESGLSLAKANRIPNVSVGLEFDSFGTDYQPGFGAGFSLTVPLFNRNQGEISRKVAESDQTKMQVEKIRRQIVTDLREALSNYKGALKVFESYKNRKKEIEDLLENSAKAFSLGGITVLDMIDTERTHKDFITKYNQAFIQSMLNKELLKVYTGEIKL